MARISGTLSFKPWVGEVGAMSPAGPDPGCGPPQTQTAGRAASSRDDDGPAAMARSCRAMISEGSPPHPRAGRRIVAPA